MIQTLISFDGTLSSWWTKIVIGLLLFAFILFQRPWSSARQPPLDRFRRRRGAEGRAGGDRGHARLLGEAGRVEQVGHAAGGARMESSHRELKERAWVANVESAARAGHRHLRQRLGLRRRRRGHGHQASGRCPTSGSPPTTWWWSTGRAVVEGALRPSSDTRTHLVLHRVAEGAGRHRPHPLHLRHQLGPGRPRHPHPRHHPDADHLAAGRALHRGHGRGGGGAGLRGQTACRSWRSSGPATRSTRPWCWWTATAPSPGGPGSPSRPSTAQVLEQLAQMAFVTRAIHPGAPRCPSTWQLRASTSSASTGRPPTTARSDAAANRRRPPPAAAAEEVTGRGAAAGGYLFLL